MVHQIGSSLAPKVLLPHTNELENRSYDPTRIKDNMEQYIPTRFSKEHINHKSIFYRQKCT
jgi:hypothetical protein